MHTNPLNFIVTMIFQYQWAGIAISVGLWFWCILIIRGNKRKYYLPFRNALLVRNEKLSFLDEATSAEEAQLAFASRFAEIDESMVQGGHSAITIRQAWREYRETIIDETEIPLRVAARPEGYFLHLGDATRVLAWWSNIFVAIGLTCTFLGIVAALTVTVQTLTASSNGGNMTSALVSLLEITSVKFWTSIAGVSSSIIFRIFDRRWHARTLRELDRLCDYLERGTLFVPGQRIAVEQLKELKKQSTALTEFTTQLAIGIGDALEKSVQPMVSVLNGIQTSIDDFRSAGAMEIGEALSRNAGTEMQQLAGALSGMTSNLASMHEKIAGSGDIANEQIAKAARDFANASESMQTAFGTLNGRIDAMGSRLTEQAEASQARASERFENQQAQAQALNQQQTTLLNSAASVLENATQRASEGLSKAVDASMASAAEQSGKALDAAFQAFGERFNESSSSLVGRVEAAAVQMERIATNIDRSVQYSDAHADKLLEANRAAGEVATALGAASGEFAKAANPVREAASATSNAAKQISEALQLQTRSSEDITQRLAETTSAATRAWNEYRNRFEDVDKSLAQALDRIRDNAQQHAQDLNEQTARIDTALATAIGRLQPALDPLGELAENIEDLMGQLQAKAS